MNNLALAYLWQKFPLFDEEERRKNFSRETDDIIEKEIQTVPALLKDSLAALEGLEELPDLSHSNFLNKLFDVNLAKAMVIKVKQQTLTSGSPRGQEGQV